MAAGNATKKMGSRKKAGVKSVKKLMATPSPVPAMAFNAMEEHFEGLGDLNIKFLADLDTKTIEEKRVFSKKDQERVDKILSLKKKKKSAATSYDDQVRSFNYNPEQYHVAQHEEGDANQAAPVAMEGNEAENMEGDEAPDYSSTDLSDLGEMESTTHAGDNAYGLASSDEDEHKEDTDPSLITVTTIPRLYVATNKIFEEQKIEIATICLKVLEDTESNVCYLSFVLNYLTKLESQDLRITKLAIVSLRKVFKDILPGYRVRKLSVSEANVPVTKVVKARRAFEDNLVKYYSIYIQNIRSIMGLYDRLAKKYRRSAYRMAGTKALRELRFSYDSITTLASTAIESLANCLSEHPEFNFRTNIIDLVVPYIVNPPTEACGHALIESIVEIFRTDLSLECPYEIVKTIAKLVKKEGYNINRNVVDLFLHLRLNPEFVKNFVHINPLCVKKQLVRKIRTHSRGQKAHELAQKEITDKLKDTEAEHERSKLENTQTEMLKMVFLTYFRILKTAPTSPALPSVLRGLGQYSYSINLDFFTDLLATFRTVILHPNTTFENKLRAVHTTYKMHTGQGRHLESDLTFYSTTLYNLITEAPGYPHLFFLVCESVEFMVNYRNLSSLIRLSSLVKRLFITALHIPASDALVFIGLAHQIILKVPKAASMFENDVITGAYYIQDARDPDTANALVSPLWEAQLLLSHPHPFVALYVEELLKFYANFLVNVNCKVPELLTKRPIELIKKFITVPSKFNPPMRVPKEHFLSKILRKQAAALASGSDTQPPSKVYLPETHRSFYFEPSFVE